MAIKKTFSQLTDADSIYYISPVTLQVEAFKIKTIRGLDEERIRKAPELKGWVMIEAFTNALAIHSPDIEKIPTKVFLFRGNQYGQMALVNVLMGPKDVKEMPVVFFTSIDLAREWKKDL